MMTIRRTILAIHADKYPSGEDAVEDATAALLLPHLYPPDQAGIPQQQIGSCS